MAGLKAHYAVRDIEARILAALRAAVLGPDQRVSPGALDALMLKHPALKDSEFDSARTPDQSTRANGTGQGAQQRAGAGQAAPATASPGQQ